MSRFDRRFIDERELLSLLVESVVDYAIFVLDERGYIRTWNRGAQRLKGYRRAEIIGEHYSLFYPEDDRKAGLPEVLLARAEQHGSAKHSGWRVRKDGSRFWADVVLTALLDKIGRAHV